VTRDRWFSAQGRARVQIPDGILHVCAGCSASDIQLYVPVFAATGDTQAEQDRSLEEARRQISFYGSTPSYRAVFDHLGSDALAHELSALARRGELAAMVKLVPDELVEEVAIIEKRSSLAAAIRKRYDGNPRPLLALRTESPRGAGRSLACVRRRIPRHVNATWRLAPSGAPDSLELV